MPPQTFYNGGEKMNIALQAVFWFLLVVSGLILWFGEGHISPAVRTWMIPLHSLCAGIGFAAAIGHIYLALGVNPDSLHGMLDGKGRLCGKASWKMGGGTHRRRKGHARRNSTGQSGVKRDAQLVQSGGERVPSAG